MKGLTLQPMQEVDYNFPEDVKKNWVFLKPLFNPILNYLTDT